MDQRLIDLITEKFESKKQQKYFYAQCNDDSLSKKEKKKWCKMADEFAKETDFESLPVKAEEQNIEELVDFDGSIPTSKVKVDTAVTDFVQFATKFGLNYKQLKLHNPWLREGFLNNKSRKLYTLEIPEKGYYDN